MVVSSFRLNNDFRAPSKDTDGNGNLSFKQYKAGDTVKGYFKAKDILAAAGSPFIDLVITLDGYTIPAIMTTKVADLYDDVNGTPPEEVPANSGVASDITKIASNSYFKELTTKANYSVNGAMVGAGIGLVYAFTKGKSMIFSLLIGGVLGGLAGNYLLKNTDIGKPVTAKNFDGKESIEDKKKRLKEKQTI